MKKLVTISFMLISVWAHAQMDSTLFKRIKVDTSSQLLNMDAVYNRPFLTMGKLPVALGGYAEANWQHIGTEGITEGHQF